jgi:hypothetical protein
MGADKNSSRRMNSAYATKFTTKGTHTSLPRSHSQSNNGPTNPRSKSQLKATRKRNSRKNDLDDMQSPWRTVCGDRAAGPHGGGGRSTWGWRTVREVAADSLKKPTEPPVPHPEKLTVHALSSDSPRATSAARTVRDLHVDSPQNLSQPKTAGNIDRNKSAQEHAMNTKNSRLNHASRTVFSVTTDGPASTQIANPAQPLEGQHHLPFA